jgi:DNA mismatch repair protein MutS2
MDQHTLELLEFDKLRELLAEGCSTSLGKELAGRIEPGVDLSRIRAEQRLVTEMTEALSADLAPPLGGVRDIRLLIRRAAIGSMLNTSELLEVRDVLHATGHVFRYRMRLSERWVGLAELLTRVEDLGPVAKGIEGCIDSRGHVLDMASVELAAVRQRLKELEEKAQEHLRRLLRDPEVRQVLRYANASMSGEHFLLPVAVNHRHRIQGIVHRTSTTGETVFIEPAGLARLSAERILLKSDEDKETQKILRRLTADVARFVRPLQAAVETLASLDLVTAKARLSLGYNMTEPDLNDQGRVWLRQARHPLLEHLLRTVAARFQRAGERGHVENVPQPGLVENVPPQAVVPIDVRLGMQFNLLVITGPNTGGKTVALKTVGLLALMAQSGMHIPAGTGSQLPVFDHILADIGDEQSLEQSLSTFSSHMSRIAQILKQASPQSLVLLDELGAGTDPTEGAALGRAILDELDRGGCRAMVTTHLGDLKTYAFANPRAENAAVEFDVETLRPTFRLLIGQFGMSNAIQIARRLQLPRRLLRRAQRYLKRRQRRGTGLDKLQELRAQAEQARVDALQAELQARQERVAYEEKQRAIQEEQLAREALAAARQRLQPGDVVHLTKMRERGKVIRIDPRRKLALVQAGLGQWEVALEELEPLGPGGDVDG